MMNPFDDVYFMKRALQEAQMAFDKNEVPVGAVIVMNNQTDVIDAILRLAKFY